MGTPANSLNLTQAGIMRFNGISTFSGLPVTNHSVLIGSTANGITSLTALTNGQLVIGSTGADPVAASITAGSGVSITPGAGSLTIAVSGSSVGQTITGDTGGALSPTAGNWNILGSGSVTTSGSGSTLTNQLTGLTNHNILVGAGTATITKVAPSATSGVPLISQGSSADPLFGTAVVAGGGTGAVTLTNHGVLVGQATSAIVATAAGSAGQVLQSGGASADPTYSTATYPATAGTSGNVLTSDGTNWTSAAASGGTVTSVSGTTNRITSTGGATPVIDIAATYVGQTSITTLGTIGTGTWAGTTVAANHGGTGTITNTTHGVLIGQGSSAITATAAGSAGQVLQSGGASADPLYSTPTYPSASGTARKILVSDATNIVYSTETWAVPGTSGNVLTSDGTNWTSSASSGVGNLLTASVQLNSAQVKLLHSVPVQVIAAPGAGKGIVIVSATSKLVYGGTNVFVAGASQKIGLYYNNGTTDTNSLGNDTVTNAMIISSANKFAVGYFVSFINNQVAGILDNVNIAAFNPVATEISGNAAGDNSINITVAYYIVTF